MSAQNVVEVKNLGYARPMRKRIGATLMEAGWEDAVMTHTSGQS